MRETRIQDFMKTIGVSSYKRAGEWVQASCPVAFWTHQKKQDSNPSWGISIHDNDLSWHQCQTCGQKGSLYDLVLDLKMMHKSSNKEADIDWKKAMEIALEDDADSLIEDWDEEDDTKEKPVVVFPNAWVDSFQEGHNHPYLMARGITPDIAKELEVKFDFQSQRVCLPYRERNGNCMGMQGRDVTGQSSLRYLSYRYKNSHNMQYWIGEDKVSWDDPVILCEGPFDYMKGYLITKQMLASQTSSINYKKLDRLKDAPMLITLYDIGTGGDHARENIAEWATKNNMPIVQLVPPVEYGDLGAMPPEDVFNLLESYI
ncbi:MAG: hypothetical protein GQ570_03495 [Helicobacteraceae bacterium]|nr:hypothetical protein [Helicobacteraceae bacterium]